MLVITGVAGFKQLVRIAARCFYSGQVPKVDAPAPGAPNPKRIDTTGLAIVVLDALTKREWIEEDRLAEELQVNAKQLRKTLKVLENEQIVKREHRKFKDRLKQEEALAAGEEKKPLLSKTQSLCCIDYPSMMDMLQLKLHYMRKKLKDELAESEPVMSYKCQRCNITYTSMDAMRLYDFMDNKFKCEQCRTEVEQALGSSGETGDDQQRRARKAMLKRLQGRLEQQLKPLTEQLKELKDLDPPDHGTHVEWAREQAFKALQQAQASAGRGAKGAKGGADGSRAGGPGGLEMWTDKTVVEVQVGGGAADDRDPNGGGADEQPQSPGKAMPSWLVAESEKEAARVAEEGRAAAGASAGAAEDGADNSVQEEYVKAYREAVRKAQMEMSAKRGGSDMQGHEAKRIKVEGGGGGVKKEEEKVKAERRDSLDWEDATVVAGGAKAEAKEEGGAGEEEKVVERMDSMDWEDAGGAEEPKAEDTEKHDDDDLDWEDAS